MSDESTFRIILLVAFLILASIALYHRVKSQRSDEKLDRRQEGWFILFTLRPMGLTAMAGLITYIVSPSTMAWSSLMLPAWIRWTGVVLGALAVALLTWTLRSLGRNLTDTVITRREHTLVTHGPYAWVRHPFYSSVALTVVASSLAAANCSSCSPVALRSCFWQSAQRAKKNV